MEKVTFANLEGEKLTGILEMPVNQAPHTFALFAHCFTCSKNLNAIRNISRTLNQAGIAVLSFDFTGLGESEGEFAETNFSSNVQDLIAAAGFLADNYSAPTMLIGHSLGGAAVVSASANLESIKAIVTIGAPFDPGHVNHILK
ncbi:MAG: alpha/beta fold hydrolase [Saprospiraceae bacterium]